MSLETLPHFVHRYTEFGIDSICTRCFATVSTVTREADLERFERDHKCDPSMLERFERVLEPRASQ